MASIHIFFALAIARFRTFFIIALGVLSLSGCGNGSNCTNPSNTYTTNVGSEGVPGTYQLYVGPQSSDFVEVNTQAAEVNGAYGGFMKDMGPQSCIGNISDFPAGAIQQPPLAIILGDTYAVKFGKTLPNNENGVANYVPDGDYGLITILSYDGNGVYAVSVTPGIGALP